MAGDWGLLYWNHRNQTVSISECNTAEDSEVEDEEEEEEEDVTKEEGRRRNRIGPNQPGGGRSRRIHGNISTTKFISLNQLKIDE